MLNRKGRRGSFTCCRSILREDQNLNIATASDHLIRAVNFAVRKIDDPIYFMIAERKQLREFLMKHYPVPQDIAQYSSMLQQTAE